MHHAFLRLATTKQERRDIVTKTKTQMNIFAKKKEVPVNFW